MSKPLTMTVEQEREYRACCTSGGTEVDPVFAELDATRAALAAAEAKLADSYRERDTLNTQLEEAAKLLADERRQLTAALEAERLHADALALRLRDVIASEVGHHAANSDIGLKDHAARRAAEVK